MTLVELMVALVISSIIVFFLFSIQTRMTRAYQGQGTVSEINQNLRAAKQMLIDDIRMAGFGLGNTGYVSASPDIEDLPGVATAAGLMVSNDAFGDGNDSFRIFYTDANLNIRIVPYDETPPGIRPGQVFADTVDPPPPFANNEPAVIVTKSASCLIAVTGTNPNKVIFNPSGRPYNAAPQNPHCQAVFDAFGAGESASIQRFVSRSYRIDPNRPTEGYLQMSPSGEVAVNDWIDMGVGFTNLQLATRYFESGDGFDADGDGDPERDWYSGDNQANPDPTGVRPADAVLIQVSLSIEGRSPYGTRGAAASTVTPAFIDITNPDNNSVGDWGQSCPSSATNPCGVDLANTPDASRPARYVGEYIYRYTSSTVDLRNMGVGQ